MPRFVIALAVGNEPVKTAYLTDRVAEGGWNLWTRKIDEAASYPDEPAAEAARSTIVLQSLRDAARAIPAGADTNDDEETQRQPSTPTQGPAPTQDDPDPR